LAEERLLGVLGVVALSEVARDLHEPRRAEDEPAPLEPRDDLAGQRAPHRVGLDQHERPLHRHGGAVYLPHAACRTRGAALPHASRLPRPAARHCAPRRRPTRRPADPPARRPAEPPTTPRPACPWRLPATRPRASP